MDTPPASTSVEPSGVDARTDRGRRRREAVLDAAADAFHARGFHGASVDDVCAAAGITGPGLYRHFASKDALLMAVLDRVWTTLRPAVEDAGKLPPDQALETLLTAHLDLALEQPTALVLLIRELRHLPEDYRARARRNHGRYVDAWAQALRGVRPDLDLATARATVLAVHGLVDSGAVRGQVREVGLSRSGYRRLLGDLARRAMDVPP
jgi:AcrR family transcriptional regulator